MLETGPTVYSPEHLLRCSASKPSTAGAFAVAKKKSGLINVLLWNWYLSGVKNISNHAYETGSWYLVGVLFK